MAKRGKRGQRDNIKIEDATIMGKSEGSEGKGKDNEDMLGETRKSSEAKESEGATRTTFKETDADKAIEEQTGTPGQASKQFQKISDAEKNLYEKPLTAGGRPHPVAKPGERQL